MDISAILASAIFFLIAAAVAILVFEKLGFGSILGFIVVGVLIGPHTAGPVLFDNIELLHNVSELGIVLFMFTIGLEMRPKEVLEMRQLIFGLGFAQMLVTTALFYGFFYWLMELPCNSAIIVALALSMSSTAIVMTTLNKRKELNSAHGKATFSILMAQDILIVPIMALIPMLAPSQVETSTPLLLNTGQTVLVLGGIYLIGRYLLPQLLQYCVKEQQMGVFSLVLFIGILGAALSVDAIGISMTLGAFLLGMLLSESDFRYHIESVVTPTKSLLMSLFFLSIGMSIQVHVLAENWLPILLQIPVILVLKTLVIMALARLFKLSGADSIRTGGYLSQVGEFAFVLLAAATTAGLLDDKAHTLTMLLVALSMVSTPGMVSLSSNLATRLKSGSTLGQGATPDTPPQVVIIGFDEVGQLIDIMLTRAGVSHTAWEKDIETVKQARAMGSKVHFGDMTRFATHKAAQLNEARAVYITLRDTDRAKSLATTLQCLYPHLNVYVRVRMLTDQAQLSAKGIHAGTSYIESTMIRVSSLLAGLGMSRAEIDNLICDIQFNHYQLLKEHYSVE